MGQNETAPNNEQNKKQIEKEKEKENNKEDKEKDNHMIEILKKENDILKKQLESLNKNNNKYNTLITMLEVLEMQRKKILSIKRGNINIL
jgi:hypothetical protein